MKLPIKEAAALFGRNVNLTPETVCITTNCNGGAAQMMSRPFNNYN